MATILELSDQSLNLFKQVISLEGLARPENVVSQEIWQDEMCRFQAWVRNTGAYEGGQSSMDYRLRNSQSLYIQTVKLLVRLQELLTDLKEILEEEHISGGGYDDEPGESLEESDEDISNGAEIQHIHRNLREIISYLNRMSIAILRVPYDDQVTDTDNLRVAAASNTPIHASSPLVLTKIALHAIQSLYTLMSTQESERTSRELCEGLAELKNTLEGLQEADFEQEATLMLLKLPLCHCAKVCRELEGVTSFDQKPSLDRAESNQKQIDVQNLKSSFFEYKATISIALGFVALQNSKATTAVIEEYRKMITDAKSDLYNHLERLEDNLNALKPPKAPASTINLLSQYKVIEERNCVQQCIEICSRAHTYVDGIGPHHQSICARDMEAHGIMPSVASSAAPEETLIDEKQRLLATIRDLDSQAVTKLQALNDQIGLLNQRNQQVSDEDKDRLEKIKEDRNMLTQMLSVVAEAEETSTDDAFKNSIPENESQHLIVSTFGDLISAKQISSRPKATRLLGEISNHSIQSLSHSLEISSLDKIDFEHRYGPDYRFKTT
ncbi:hypothetical protein BJY00DRAFT_292766 [Aspergillus carlsbadensis]|nr:hypothetical protein BJY00DRAFT_292766 [Aspergillus carlsbadensis]